MSSGVSTVAGLTVAGILASAPFGIPMEQIALGTCFAIVGVVGRAALELQKAAEGTSGGIPISKIAGWVGAGFIGAPFVTVALLVVLNLMGIKADGLICLGLLFMGFGGPRMMIWLINTAISLVNKKTGLNIPMLGGTTNGPPPPPPAAVPQNNEVH